MKIILPDYQFEYEVTKDGLKSVGHIFESPTDKQLYLAILENLQVDFKNAAVNVSDGNVFHQIVKYIIDANKYLNIETDQPLNIKKYAEAMDQNQLRKMSFTNPLFGTYEETTDLQ